MRSVAWDAGSKIGCFGPASSCFGGEGSALAPGRVKIPDRRNAATLSTLLPICELTLFDAPKTQIKKSVRY